MRTPILVLLILSGCLLTASNLAEADNRKHWRSGHWDRGYDRHWDRARWAHRQGRRSWRSGYRAGRQDFYWGPRHHWRRGAWGYGRDRWAYGAGGLATGIIIGSQIGNDRYCPDERVDRRWDRRHSQSRDEVTGCYRIEVLPDGTERRVELPLSDCR